MDVFKGHILQTIANAFDIPPAHLSMSTQDNVFVEKTKNISVVCSFKQKRETKYILYW